MSPRPCVQLAGRPCSHRCVHQEAGHAQLLVDPDPAPAPITDLHHHAHLQLAPPVVHLLTPGLIPDISLHCPGPVGRPSICGNIYLQQAPRSHQCACCWPQPLPGGSLASWAQWCNPGTRDRAESGPTSSYGGIGYWCALLWLQDLTKVTHMAVEANEVRSAACKCTTGRANLKRFPGSEG